MVGTLIARKALAGAYDSLNRHDLDAFMSAWRTDGVFTYPGEIPQSGTFRGRNAVERWFRYFFGQFPTLRFEVRAVCVRDIFDFVGTNVVAVHWDLSMINREGREGQESGVTVVGLERGKVVHAQDFLFDLGENFRRNWSAGRAEP